MPRCPVPAPTLPLRDRRSADLPDLLVLLRRTHEQEGYPVRATAVSADWLASSAELSSAVALDDGRVVGHVALHPGEHEDDAALEGWQAATGRAPDRLAVVSRLFTDRSVSGAGAALLGEAVRRAEALGRTPVLLVDPVSPACGWYARRGWREVGTAVQHWGHRTVDAVLMVPGSRDPVSELVTDGRAGPEPDPRRRHRGPRGPAVRPMVKIRIYGCSHGATSSRASERRGHHDVAYGRCMPDHGRERADLLETAGLASQAHDASELSTARTLQSAGSRQPAVPGDPGHDVLQCVADAADRPAAAA